MTNQEIVLKYLKGSFEPVKAMLIAEDLGIPRKSVQDALGRLKQNGLVDWDRFTGWYPILPPTAPVELSTGYTWEELQSKLLVWAYSKGLLKNPNPTAQLAKTLEEAVETLQAVIKKDEPEIIDGLGDILVTIIIAAEQMGYDLLDCGNHAYSVIKDRTGKNVNGMFVKD
jgi:NTP pyrophosphatase (non-canonical NTP hydrolase)